MSNVIEITDLSDPALDIYARMSEAQLRNRRNPDNGFFIAESARVVGFALDAGCRPVSLLVERRQLESHSGILDRCGDVPIYSGDQEVLKQLTGFTLSRGFLCAMHRPEEKTAEEVLTGATRIAVLDGIVDSTNLGAIFRSAAALNMDAVLLTPGCCDPLLRRAARVSMGTVFQIPWARLGRKAEDWPEGGLRRLKESGFATAALALEDSAISISDPRLKAEPRLALLLGTEGDGLAPATVSGCDYTVRIPMSRGVDSLNVAAASAVAFWEVSRKEN